MALDSDSVRNYKVFQDIDLARNKILNSTEIVAPCWKKETDETELGSLTIRSGYTSSTDNKAKAQITVSNSGNVSIETDSGLDVSGTSNFNGDMTVSSDITVTENESNSETKITSTSVTTDNVVFNETLESNGFEIVWDSKNSILTFRKNVKAEESKEIE